MNLRSVRLLPSLLLALPLLSAAATVEERLTQLESELAALRAENGQLRHELASSPAAPPAATKPTAAAVKVGGFIQLQGEALDRGDARFSNSNDRLYLRRARFHISGAPFENVTYKIELETAGSLADTSGYRLQATDAWVALQLSPAVRIRAGQFKTPFGYEQLLSDLKALTIERSLPNDRLTLNRQIGAQLEGDLGDTVTYAVGMFNGTATNTNANDNDAFLWAGRVAAKPINFDLKGQEASVTAGINAYYSEDKNVGSQPSEFLFDSVAGGTRDNIFAGLREGAGIDAQLKLPRFELWGEYLLGNFDPKNHLPRTEVKSNGWYTLGAYMIVPKKLQGVVKYETFTADDAIGGSTTKTWTAGLNWLLHGDDLKFMTDYLVTDLPGSAPRDQKVIVRLQTVF